MDSSNIFWHFTNRILIKLENAATREFDRQQTIQDKKNMKAAHRDHLDELFDAKLVPGVKKTQMREDYSKIVNINL